MSTTQNALKEFRHPRLAFLHGLMFIGALALAGCDPGAVDEWLQGHGGNSAPPAADGGQTPPPSSCAATLCVTGTHCEEQPVQCLRAPCPVQAVCVKDGPAVSCGGIAGRLCPGSGKCIDDPSDSCNPARGGADCGGICSCVENVACVRGLVFDASPGVCACVAVPPPPPTCGPVCDIFCQYGNVLDAQGCPTCRCNPPPPPVDPCATVRCAAGTHCQATPAICVTAPCPPVAACVPDAAAVRCGGLAGRPCPGAGRCVDDPTDSCDPAHGGADCGGICQCVQTVLCVKGATFDSSPTVCACVPSAPPPPPVCGPVCLIYCQFGNVLDAAGCPSCRCNPASTAQACPVEKCTGPGPKSATYQCPDGKTTAGPACLLTAASSCEWAVVTCPG